MVTGCPHGVKVWQIGAEHLIISIVEQTQTVSDVQRLLGSLGVFPEPVAAPAFVVVSGLPGTGKSHLCRMLAERAPFMVLESDALRKVLFPAPSYSAAESARLFQAIHLLLEKLLSKGIPVILDATSLTERYRQRLYSIAERHGARLILVWVEAPPELVEKRLKEQPPGTRGESEAGWEVYQKMKVSAERIRRNHYVVDTSRDITPVLDKIVREVRR